MSELPDHRHDTAEDDTLEHTDDRPWPNHPKHLGPTDMFTGNIDELTDEQVKTLANDRNRIDPRDQLTFQPPDSAPHAAASSDRPAESVDHLSEPGDRPAESSEHPADPTDLDRPLSDEPDAPTIRQVLERFAGPDGLTAQQQQDDEAYVAAHGDQRPWLRISDDPLVRHVYSETDRQGNHAPARHDAWGDAETQRQRTEGLKDPGHATDSPAYHNSVDAFKGQPPPDNIGGAGKQHRCGEHNTWINDPTVWAAATARILEHPRVKEALVTDQKIERIQDIPIADILGEDGRRHCEGYSIDSTGFDSVNDAIKNRDKWTSEVRKSLQGMPSLSREQAEHETLDKYKYGHIPWIPPTVKDIENFNGGTFQVNLKQNPNYPGNIAISIFINPPTDREKPGEERA